MQLLPPGKLAATYGSLLSAALPLSTAAAKALSPNAARAKADQTPNCSSCKAHMIQVATFVAQKPLGLRMLRQAMSHRGIKDLKGQFEECAARMVRHLPPGAK